ncbi:MAG: MMPL family transporter [Actinomycetales bacterium]|nr:MMPL family transporter [Actinomycetales bacterium]
MSMPSAPANPTPTPADASPRRQRRSARRAIWAAVGVVVAWFLISGAVGPLSGQLSQVQENDNASFLPASAESTLVADEQKAFFDNPALPVLVVVSTPGGGALSPAAQQQAAALAESIPGLEVEPGRTVADFTDGTPIAPIPSQDGEAMLINVNVTASQFGEQLADGSLAVAGIVNAIRGAAADYPDLQVNVTGPAGILSDLIKVFGAIDIQLLGATLLVVILILIVVYRSPFIWVLPIISALLANAMAGAVVYALAKADIIVLNGQSQGILTVLVIGAATDYALLMIARYREELHHYESHVTALKVAWRGVVEPIVASGATVSIGLLCLLLSQLNSNRSLGPVGAVGIAACLVVLLTLLPALLAIPVVSIPLLAFLVPVLGWIALEVIGQEPAFGPFAATGGALCLVAIVFCIVVGILRAVRPDAGPFSRARIPAGRWVFWPRIPRVDDTVDEGTGLWSRVASGVSKRPRVTWIATAFVLLILAGFTGVLKADGISTTETFTDASTVDSVIGQQVLQDHFAAGLGTPAIVVANADSAAAVTSAVESTPGVDSVAPFTGAPAGPPGAGPAAEPKVVDGRVLLQVTLADPADSAQAEDTIALLRDRVHAIAGADALVGGQTAAQLDVDLASMRDRNLIIPVVLVVIFIVLMLLLRSLLAPVLLIVTVLLSYFATLGVCALLFNEAFGFPGADTSFPLFAFVFLVALGVDYNIFLMTRVREESIRLGTRPGILKGLRVTGGVITSAGIVLAATFLVLGVLPLVILRELGLAVAIGVLLDTFVVRSTLVPALAYDLGQRIWWPSRLSRQPREPEPGQVAASSTS